MSEPIEYNPEPTAKLFHASKAFVRAIMGPLGSGKSSTCCMEIFYRACQQQPYNGVRSTRAAIIRETYPMLKSTTLNTWQEWVPDEVCHVSLAAPYIGKGNFALGDGTRVDTEIHFLALDQEDDVGKLKSLDLTFGWVNEVSEIDKLIFDMLTGRVGRYPPQRKGGPTWHGVIMDTNPPDDESWYHLLAEEEQPEDYEFFRQPPAVLKIPKKSDDDQQLYVPNQGQGPYPPAENIANLPGGYDYYMRMIPGKDEEWIKVFLEGEYGTIIAGKPVYPEYKDSIHCAKEPIQVHRGLPLLLGMDFGYGNPALAVCQITPKGQFRVIEEVVTDNVGMRQFATDIIRPLLMNKYKGMRYHCIGDPAGASHSLTDGASCIAILREEGIPTDPARTNVFTARKEAVTRFLNRMSDGFPSFQISPTCKTLRKAFQGGYKYKPIKLTTGKGYSKQPEKNIYSHISDAVQYACLEAENVASAVLGGATQIRGRRNVVNRSAKGWT